MRKTILLSVLLFASLFASVPFVDATQAATVQEPIDCSITDFTVLNKDLSREELLAFPGYVDGTQEIRQEPRVSIMKRGLIEPSTWINFPYPSPVTVMIVVDDDMKSMYESLLRSPQSWSAVYSWANNILEMGDDPFWSWYEIDFVTQEYRQWYSPQDTLLNLLWAGLRAFPRPAGIDVTVIMTAQIEGGLSPPLGWAIGDAFIMSVRCANYLVPVANVWQHEASHLYGAPDHSDWWSAMTTWCIMSYMWISATRNWCSGCSSKIYLNRLKFGYYYKTIWIY